MRAKWPRNWTTVAASCSVLSWQAVHRPAHACRASGRLPFPWVSGSLRRRGHGWAPGPPGSFCRLQHSSAKAQAWCVLPMLGSAAPLNSWTVPDWRTGRGRLWRKYVFIRDGILLTEERIKKKNLYHIRLEDFFGDMNVLKAFQPAEIPFPDTAEKHCQSLWLVKLGP